MKQSKMRRKRMKISQIWDELENDNSFSHGLLIRRYSGTVLPDVYIALTAPERFRCIAASVSSLLSVNLTPFSNLKDISLELKPDENKPERTILLLKLINNLHNDIFSLLCEDLILAISEVTDEKQLIKELLNRFEKWKSLFDRAALMGLLPEEQRGLFGELYFLRKFLSINSDYQNVINSWIGPERQIRDFQSGEWSVEVKTTHGNNHQKLHITNERQLDTSNLKYLFLYHLSLDSREQAGTTLNQIIQSVSEILLSDYISLNRFKNKLLEVGYFDIHSPLYDKIGYFVRQDIFYKVENDFPRIEEKDIRPGTGDVNYTIIVSQCSSFAKTEEEVLQSLIFN
jgi:hypothetical protein